MNSVDIPSAFKAFTTVQALAPIAKYASGTVTTALHLSGTLGKNMMPQLKTLSGDGTHATSVLTLHDFPAMQKIVDVTKLQFLNNPTLQPLKAAFAIQDGRLSVKPFDVKAGGITMNVAGSNGLDQSLLYTLGLAFLARCSAAPRTTRWPGSCRRRGARGSISLPHRRFRWRSRSAAA